MKIITIEIISTAILSRTRSRAVVSYWRKYRLLQLVYLLELSLPMIDELAGWTWPK